MTKREVDPMLEWAIRRGMTPSKAPGLTPAHLCRGEKVDEECETCGGTGKLQSSCERRPHMGVATRL